MILKKFSLEEAKKNQRKTFGTNEPNELFPKLFGRKTKLNEYFGKETGNGQGRSTSANLTKRGNGRCRSFFNSKSGQG